MTGSLHAEFGGYEELTAEDVFNESIMLGLRTVEGVLLSSLDQSLLLEIKGEILRHCRLGNLVKDGDKIRIPSEKLFVSDGIIKDLFI
jgi:oxygen-independent coproporphyrinogen-3 oxidase